MMKKLAWLMVFALLLASVGFAPAALADETALYLESTKIQLTGDADYKIRVTANAKVRYDLAFSIEYDGKTFEGVMPAGEKETFILIHTDPVEAGYKTTLAINRGSGYRVSTSRGKATVTVIPDPVLIPAQGGMTVAPAGDAIRVVFTMENNKILTSPLTLELRDVDGKVLDTKSFSKDYEQASFKFTIPKDWKGTNYVALWMGEKQVSEDYIVEIRKEIPAIVSVSTDRKAIAVGVDCDAGTAEQARSWLALLNQHNAKATFFVTGKFAEKNPEVLKEIAEQGHEIGNHSWNHNSMIGMKFDEVKSEVESTSKAISDAVGGYTTWLFRAPDDKWGFGLSTMLDTLDLTLVEYTRASGDSEKGASGDDVYKNVTGENAAPGAIYLFRNDTPVFDTMDKVLAYYVQNGFEIVTISDLLPDGGFTIDKNGVVSEDE